jgi:two-component system response regulator YesN
MLDVILVDDEPAVLRRLKTIVPWETLGWRVVATAGDGEDGLAAIEEHSPDLVITDIRMPVLDGLELADRASALDHPPEIVFLTGYGEFELVRRALRMGAVDYLLKPVDADKLREALRLVKQRRLAHSDEDTALDWARRALAGDLRAEEQAPFDFSQYSIIVLHVRYATEGGARETASHEARGEGSGLICARRGALDSDYLLAVRDDDDDAAMSLARSLIEESRPGDVVVGIGKPAYAPAHIERSAAQARRAADEAYYEGTGRPIRASDLVQSWAPGTSDAILDARTRLMSVVRTMDGAGVQKIIEDLRAELERRRPDPVVANQQLLDLATALRLEFGGKASSPVSERRAIATLSDTLSLVRSEAVELIGQLGAKWGARTEPISDWVRRYLRTHYSEAVTLKLLADLAHLSPVYLGHRFREETGHSFQTELLETRMRIAADALLGSDAPIHVIARQVGYTAPVNFYRGFKRIHGMSPAQFRASHMKEKE